MNDTPIKISGLQKAIALKWEDVPRLAISILKNPDATDHEKLTAARMLERMAYLADSVQPLYDACTAALLRDDVADCELGEQLRKAAALVETTRRLP